ncbi:hypothetical protein PENPOL_c037G08868 [Penicillium polonicum]|uniref:Uncharacterized protein n=1 Tax=Penicillium polonicum TaxID=60169 RepID=A0A1V6N5K8_PENPO|nr:hypothetical protein PENPOL_c037G08868 [Penicillium polonicum]
MADEVSASENSNQVSTL